jgi:hypothetical protein
MKSRHIFMIQQHVMKTCHDFKPSMRFAGRRRVVNPSDSPERNRAARQSRWADEAEAGARLMAEKMTAGA